MRLIIPFPAGAATDMVGRAVGQKLAEAWGQSVVVENRSGAGTGIAAELVAKSAPDGYTLFMAANETLSINQHLYTKLNYDPARDFALVRGLFAAKHLLLLHPSVPAGSLAELVSHVRANPDKLSYASVGSGSPTHLNMELFKSLASAGVVHVPYKGAAPGITDLVGGRVQLMLMNIAVATPHLKSGRIKALAIGSDRRSAVLPDVPTFAEAGFPGFESQAWFAIVAPAGTPPAIVERIGRDIEKVLNLPEIRDQRLAEQGLEAMPLAPEPLAALVKRDAEKFAKLIKETGAKAD